MPSRQVEGVVAQSDSQGEAGGCAKPTRDPPPGAGPVGLATGVQRACRAPRCRHCRRRRATKDFGLCGWCWRCPWTRRRYAVRLGGAPTAVRPGPGKVPVLRDRLRRAEPLWQPGDPEVPFPLESIAHLLLTGKLPPGVELVRVWPPKFRARPADPNKRGRKVHLGYFDNIPAAQDEVIRWTLAGRPPAAGWRRRPNPAGQSKSMADPTPAPPAHRIQCPRCPAVGPPAGTLRGAVAAAKAGGWSFAGGRPVGCRECARGLLAKGQGRRALRAGRVLATRAEGRAGVRPRRAGGRGPGRHAAVGGRGRPDR
jgi:hypothetical protein